MPIIKLNATDSTNDYLKQLARENQLDNYTVVMAFEQTKGRGQMGAQWFSEPGKNLTMSVLIKDLNLESQNVFDLNVMVALTLVEVLQQMMLLDISIKWPNDIMAGGRKVGGILIENSLKPDGSFYAVVGVGLNVNQTNFDGLPQASSLLNHSGEMYDVETLAAKIASHLTLRSQHLVTQRAELWHQYHQLLFKRNKPVAFEAPDGNRFMGIIQEVLSDGQLAVLREDDSVAYYEVKEIKMLY